MQTCRRRKICAWNGESPDTNTRSANAWGGFGLRLTLGSFLLQIVNGNRLSLAGSLVFGEVEFFLNFTLAPAQLMVTLLALEGCADLGFQFRGTLVRIDNVTLQFGSAFFKTLDCRFERADCAQRRVRDTRAVTVLPAHNNLDGVVEARTQKQIESGEAPDPNVITEAVLQLFSTPQDQLAGDAPVVERLSVEFYAEIFSGRVLTRCDVLPQIGQPCGECFGVLV